MDLVVGSLCFVIVFAVVGVLIAVAFVAASKARRRRMDTIAGYAAQREWRYSPTGPGLEQRFRGDPFGRGRQRTATNVVEGTYEGRAFLAFDYSYRSGTGDDDSTYRCSVLTMHLGCTAPMLQVAPQGSLGRFFTGLFGNDLAVGDPVFDQAFSVRTDSVEFARDVLHRDLTAMLAAYQDRAWRIEGDSLLMFRTGQHTIQEIDAVLASMKAILDRIPPPVWERLRGETPR